MKKIKNFITNSINTYARITAKYYTWLPTGTILF